MGLLLLLPTLPKGTQSFFTETLSIKEVKRTDLDVVKLRGCSWHPTALGCSIPTLACWHRALLQGLVQEVLKVTVRAGAQNPDVGRKSCSFQNLYLLKDNRFLKNETPRGGRLGVCTPHPTSSTDKGNYSDPLAPRDHLLAGGQICKEVFQSSQMINTKL